MKKRPNILFLMSDEHRFDVAGFAGDPLVRTPNLDKLAASGYVFDNCYTPAPICIPGRQAMMAGKHCKNIGCLKYGDDLEPNSMTFAKRFSQYNYSTVCCGKLHHYGPDQMQGWTKRVAPDTNVSARFVEGKIEGIENPPLENGCGKWTNQKEVERAGIAHGPYQHIDCNVISETKQAIEMHFNNPFYDRPTMAPILLKVSLLQPHYPFFTDKEKFNYYLNRVEVKDAERADHPVLQKTQCGPPVNASKRDRRRALAAYYGMVETVDSHFGEVIEALENVGQNLDEWIIVYTSDHGDMLGEHGVWEKTRFYEGSVRTPLIIRWPKNYKGGRHIEENVNLIDLFPTLCELGGLEAPDDLDGHSLVPLLNGDTSQWDNESISHFGDNHLMIKRDALKYQWYGEDVPEVLFDLESDPTETTNFIDEPDYQEHLTRFRKRKAELGY